VPDPAARLSAWRVSIMNGDSAGKLPAGRDRLVAYPPSALPVDRPRATDYDLG
jgi:hypothetical protein